MQALPPAAAPPLALPSGEGLAQTEERLAFSAPYHGFVSRREEIERQEGAQQFAEARLAHHPEERSVNEGRGGEYAAHQCLTCGHRARIHLGQNPEYEARVLSNGRTILSATPEELAEGVALGIVETDEPGLVGGYYGATGISHGLCPECEELPIDDLVISDVRKLQRVYGDDMRLGRSEIEAARAPGARLEQVRRNFIARHERLAMTRFEERRAAQQAALSPEAYQTWHESAAEAEYEAMRQEEGIG